MIKIAICDDDENIVLELQEYIFSFMKNSSVNVTIFTYFSSLDLFTKIHMNDFDVLFLDYDMPQLNGYELAKKIRKFNNFIKIVFITNYKEYMHLAFSVHAYDYIVKPLEQDKIEKTMTELLSLFITKHVPNLLTFKFNLHSGIKSFNVDEMQYFEFVSRKVCLYTTEDNIFLPRGETISNIANMMKTYGFATPHKSFVVNLYHVNSIKGYNVYLKSGAVIPLSQSKSTEFRQKMNHYLKLQIKTQFIEGG